MKVGQFEIRTFVEQHFRLDGGLMFGVVPKSLWERLIPPDENNLIPMVNNIFVLSAHGKNYIFDAGLGDSLSDKEKKIYGTDGVSALETGLRSFGLSVDDIDYVLLTHLHTDHAGGAVKSENGKYVPRFPNARYVISKLEWEAALHPDERTSAVYIPERFYPLEESGQLQLVEPNCKIADGISLIHTGGHSAGHYGIEIESEGSKVFYYADIFPFTHNIRLPFVPATDVYPLQSLAVKRELVPRLIREQVILAFDHDMQVTFGKVLERDGRVAVQPVVTGIQFTTTMTAR